MLVTHYSIALADDEVDAVRQRIAVIGPQFDRLPGLIAKLFLLASDTPCYALYYLWQSPDALQEFLDGSRFAALVARFGRPTLHHYLTRATALPFRAGERIECTPDVDGIVRDGVHLHELRSGDHVTLRSVATGRFDVVYVAGSRQRVEPDPTAVSTPPQR